MRTITLELLRHGPPHNQLLSPLTPYLALCENHAAVTVHVPFEHNQFLYRLHALGYRLGEESREFQMKDTAKVLGDVLATIPGLTAELSKNHGDQEKLTHLRLIISASELALLPFELALAANGFPGAGQPLLLQSQLPLCLTREIRRVAEEHLQWPSKPRILFVAAAPPDVGSVPIESHLLALRRVIGPWVKYYDSDDVPRRRARVEEHLVVLPQATVESIEAACASGGFTHVHILAHGVERQEGYDVRFGLALHNPRDPQGESDIVSGARLATILRASQKPEEKGLARPSVVTMATCNSGNVGSVAGAGASIAHALHEAGIPMVVAGQFPLSFAGSVRLVEVLYAGLLWGVDPRLLLNDLRRRLHSQFPATHDWASLTAYASLPPDFDQHLRGVQIQQAMESINVAMDHADEATKRFSQRFMSRQSARTAQETNKRQNEELLERAQQRINAAKERMEHLLTRTSTQRSHVYALLASTDKRQAEILHAWTKISWLNEERRQQTREESNKSLRKARDYYWEAFLLDRASSWAVVQYLSLTLILQKSGQLPSDIERPERDPTALWILSHILSLNDLHSEDPERTVWAYGNLVELYLLSLLMPVGHDRSSPDEAGRRALKCAHELIAVAGRDSFEVYSTRRQILRYIEWFGPLANLTPLIALAEQLYHALSEENWQ
jgi:hypothetical protein